MSEVQRYTESCMEGGGVAESRSGEYVAYTDFDAEHVLRLEAEREVSDLRHFLKAEVARADQAERQVGELREQLSDTENDVDTIAHHNIDLQAKLDTAMGLLRDSSGHIASVVNELLQCSQGDGLVAANERTAVAYAALKAGHRVNAFLNTTSTEGKDHE